MQKKQELSSGSDQAIRFVSKTTNLIINIEEFLKNDPTGKRLSSIGVTSADVIRNLKTLGDDNILVIPKAWTDRLPLGSAGDNRNHDCHRHQECPDVVPERPLVFNEHRKLRYPQEHIRDASLCPQFTAQLQSGTPIVIGVDEDPATFVGLTGIIIGKADHCLAGLGNLDVLRRLVIDLVSNYKYTGFVTGIDSFAEEISSLKLHIGAPGYVNPVKVSTFPRPPFLFGQTNNESYAKRLANLMHSDHTDGTNVLGRPVFLLPDYGAASLMEALYALEIGHPVFAVGRSCWCEKVADPSCICASAITWRGVDADWLVANYVKRAPVSCPERGSNITWHL